MVETTQEAKDTAPRLRRQRKVGVVVSTKMEKTVVVAVERLVAHPVYGKRMRRTNKFFAHDEKGECRQGDHVAIVESRPYSSRKRWRVSGIVRRAAITEVVPAGKKKRA